MTSSCKALVKRCMIVDDSWWYDRLSCTVWPRLKSKRGPFRLRVFEIHCNSAGFWVRNVRNIHNNETNRQLAIDSVKIQHSSLYRTLIFAYINLKSRSKLLISHFVPFVHVENHSDSGISEKSKLVSLSVRVTLFNNHPSLSVWGTLLVQATGVGKKGKERQI